MGQWNEFKKKCYFMLSYIFWHFFVASHHKICVFIIFIIFLMEYEISATEC